MSRSPVARRILRFVVPVVGGIALGSIVAASIFGDPIHIAAAPISGIAFFFLLAALGSASAPAGRITGTLAAGRLPGIQGPGSAPLVVPRAEPVLNPSGAVLNPQPTATPATGATLNGEPVALGTPESRSPRRPGSVRRTLGRVLTLLLVLAGIALALLPAGRLVAWHVAGIADGRWDAADPRTGIHQQEMVDEIAAVAGGHRFTWVGFYDGYVLAGAPTDPTATTTDTFQWRYGRAARLGPASGNLDGLFDASGFDFGLVGAATRFAIADSGWTGLTSIYPSVRLGDDGDPEITVTLMTAYHSGSYVFSAEGEYRERFGSEWE